MLNTIPPQDIEDKLNWLREFYAPSQLIGELIFICESQHNHCEFIKPMEDQDSELASLQFYGSIYALYIKEKERIEAVKLTIT